MLPFENELLLQLSSSLPTSVDNELASWNSLAFQFDMDNDNRLSGAEGRGLSRKTRATNPSGSSVNNTDAHDFDAALLAQFAAHAETSAAGHQSFQQQPQHTPQAHDPSYAALLQNLIAHSQPPSHPQDLFQHHHQIPQPHPPHPEIPFLQQQWGSNSQTMDAYYAGMLAALQGASQQQQQHFFPSGLVHNLPQITHPHTQPLMSQHSQQASPTIPGPPHAPSLSGSGPDQSPDEQGEDDTGFPFEDKRRRNTAASARFRVKKKQRTLNLERQVSDLTGRTEELEKEANELRRENGWLKEIVMLKGSTKFQLANPTTATTSTAAVPPPAFNVESAGEDRTELSDEEDGDDSGEYGKRNSKKGKSKARKT